MFQGLKSRTYQSEENQVVRVNLGKKNPIDWSVGKIRGKSKTLCDVEGMELGRYER